MNIIRLWSCVASVALTAFASDFNPYRTVPVVELKDGRSLKQFLALGYTNDGISGKWDGGKGVIAYELFPIEWGESIARFKPKPPPPPIEPVTKQELQEADEIIGRASKARQALDQERGGGSRDRRLEDLKRSFPNHTAGPVTPRSDPLVHDCYNRYLSMVKSMSTESMPADLLRMRNQLEKDMIDADLNEASRREPRTGDILSPRPRVLTPSMRAAMRQNRDWLKTKVLPFLVRLEGFQRSQ